MRYAQQSLFVPAALLRRPRWWVKRTDGNLDTNDRPGCVDLVGTETLTSGTPPPPRQNEQWREVQLLRTRLDSEHVVGKWMAEQFVPLLHRVMNQQFTDPKTVPERLLGSAVCRAVEQGLERVVVLPLSRDYWEWKPQSHLLVVAEAKRINTSKYEKVLAAVARH